MEHQRLPSTHLRRRDDAAVDEGKRRVDTEMRRGRVAFGVEELEQVFIALRDAERRGRRVEVDLGHRGRMQTAEIDDPLAVDEHPEVVVPFELERLAARVLEFRVKL